MANRHVFVSYCHDNRIAVTRLRLDLVRAGIPVWWDQEILPGADWKLEIRKAMRDAFAVVVCLSKETSERAKTGVYPELLDAIAAYHQCQPRAIFLIPVRLSPCDIPLVEIDDTRTLDRLQAINLFPEEDYQQAFQRLVRALNSARPTPVDPNGTLSNQAVAGATRNAGLPAGAFDVFLSHNSHDKPMVRQLADALIARGLRPWLDERELVPGRPWQDALEEIIKTTRTAAVLVGRDGLGPWEAPEMRACLSEFVNRKLPVIPVLLPGTANQPELPIFLKAFTWVDMRGGLTDAGIDRLVWGITSEKPAGAVVNAKAPVAPPVTTESPSGPLATWQRKLAFLQTEEAKTSNAAQKFELQHQIEEAKAKIKEFERL